MATLAEIRAKLQEQENRGGGSNTGGGDNAIFPFWNIPENSTSVLRFLPDGDSSNTYLGLENMYQNMENTMEDLTVNKQAAEFERQQQEQQRANILQSMRGAAGSSGIAALAQSIAKQEQANQQAARQEASRIQDLRLGEDARIQGLERTGELKSREMEAAKIDSLLALAAGDVQGAQALAQQGVDAMSAGIQQAGEGVLQAGTSIADRIEEE